MSAEQQTHGAFAAKQPLLSRIWRFLGFGLSGYVDMVDWRTDDTDTSFAPGALVTDSYITIGFADRVWLLISGKARLEVSTKTDVVVKRSESRSIFGVLPPGYR